MRDWHAFNRGVVEQFRANGGVGPGRWATQPLLLLTTTGARSGLPRTTPLLYSTDGDRLVVIASKGGEPTHPDWYHNLLAHPEATVEGERRPFPCGPRWRRVPSGGGCSISRPRRCPFSPSMNAPPPAPSP